MKLLESLHTCDLHTFDWCLRRRNRELLTQISRWVSWTADGHLYLLGAFILWLSGYTEIVTALFAALCVERLLYVVLKKHFRRNRPPQAIPGFRSVVEPSDQFSFPSGHTSAAFLCAVFVAVFSPSMGALLFCWATLVGISRVMLGVHFPTDTLAGATLGSSIALLTLNQGGFL